MADVNIPILTILDENGNEIPIPAIQGKTPVKGVDYFTQAELRDVAQEAAKLVEPGDKDAVLFTPQELTPEQMLRARENIGAYNNTVGIYGIYPGEVNAAKNTEIINQIVNSDGVKFLIFDSGDYYFNDYIPLISSGKICGAGESATVLHFPDGKSGIKADKAVYYSRFTISDLTIIADVPIDLSDDKPLGYHDSVLERLILNGGRDCVLGKQNDRNVNGDPLTFHMIFRQISVNCTMPKDPMNDHANSGFRNLYAGILNTFDTIIDRGKNVDVMFAATTGAFQNVNCSYGRSVNYVWYFAEEMAAYLGFGLTIDVRSSNFEAINKAIIYSAKSNEYKHSWVGFDNCIFDFNKDTKENTLSAITLSMIGNVTISNTSIRSFDETHAPGVSVLNIAQYVGPGTCIDCKDSVTITGPGGIKLLPGNSRTCVQSPIDKNQNIKHEHGISSEFFFGGRILKEDTPILYEYYIKPKLGSDVVVLTTDYKYDRVAKIVSVVTNQGTQVLRAGSILTVINKSSGPVRFAPFSETTGTEFGFTSLFTLPVGGSATLLLLRVSPSLFVWKPLGYTGENIKPTT